VKAEARPENRSIQDEKLKEDLKQQLEQLRTVRQPWEGLIKECMEYALPRRSTWDDAETEGNKPSRRLYNTEAIKYLGLQSKGFQGYMIPRNSTWFKLRIAGKEKTPIGAQRWLEEVERIMYGAFSMSNFYDAMSEFIPDSGCSGTAVVYIGEGEGGKIQFSPRHPFESFIAQDENGEVDTLFREFRMTRRAMISQFGESSVYQNVKLGAEKNPYEKVRILHAVMPRGSAGKAAGSKRFASYYLDLENSHMLRTGGYDEFPYLVWRPTRNSYETYGRSATMDALPDIKMLNQMARTTINLAQMISDPPLNIPESMKGFEQIVPHGYNYNAAGQKIEPVVLGQNYPISLDAVNRQSQLVKDSFNVDFYLLLSQAQQSGHEKTVREVIELQGEKAAILGVTINSFESEVLQPCIQRMFAILQRRGEIPPIPQDLQAVGGRIEIDYVGPMAQAQKKYYQTQGVTQALNVFLPVAQAIPSMMDRINPDELGKAILDGLSMPAIIQRDDQEVEQVRKAVAAQQQQMMQQQMGMEQEKTIAANVDKLNQQVQPGSLLESMGKAAGGKR
jgi:hypothetical protein